MQCRCGGMAGMHWEGISNRAGSSDCVCAGKVHPAGAQCATAHALMPCTVHRQGGLRLSSGCIVRSEIAFQTQPMYWDQDPSLNLATPTPPHPTLVMHPSPPPPLHTTSSEFVQLRLIGLGPLLPLFAFPLLPLSAFPSPPTASVSIYASSWHTSVR